MSENKSINAWLSDNRLRWVDGREQFYKSTLSWAEARPIIEQLEAEGAVRANG